MTVTYLLETVVMNQPSVKRFKFQEQDKSFFLKFFDDNFAIWLSKKKKGEKNENDKSDKISVFLPHFSDCCSSSISDLSSSKRSTLYTVSLKSFPFVFVFQFASQAELHARKAAEKLTEAAVKKGIQAHELAASAELRHRIEEIEKQVS